MKKYMNMPDVRIVRFENKDVIVTSGPMGPQKAMGFQEDVEAGGLVQERRSIWD